LKLNAPLKIYDAAAGSGKTFTLVKEYLKRILSSNNESHYKHLLAITFTNKAVSEMKQRIISNLVFFSKKEFMENPSEMGKNIASELDLTLQYINSQSKKVVKHVLHHYSFFSVETIDHFNHRIIRTFARDLKLSGNFDVDLDVQKLISEAVDQLISKAGDDQKITKVLIDFAIEKTNDDRSWDISKDITKISQLLYKETEEQSVLKLKKKSIDDFLVLNTLLKKEKTSITKNIKILAKESLQLIEEAGLEFNDFTRSSVPNYFKKLANEDFNVKFNANWQTTMGEQPLYPGRVDATIAAIIDELTPAFKTNFEKTKSLVHQLMLYSSMLKNSVPLSVINLVSKEIEVIKEEKNIVPISEFNSLIYQEIKNQPAPFIYERLGEQYRHFFIDEFQDTSFLQWQNLVPLIDNALSQEYEDNTQGSLLLVGDAKQSIYRWRGGLPEQFIDLCTDTNPFFTEEAQIESLPVNYRSCKEIIEFNNQFFTFISKYLGNSVYQQLYKTGNNQITNSKEGGFVKIEFIESEKKEERHLMYAEKVDQTIDELLVLGYNYSDICILTRKKSEGVALGTYLLEKEVPIISNETLLLNHSGIVNFLINAITLSLNFNHEEVKVKFLDFLYDHFSISEERHTFFESILYTSEIDFPIHLAKHGIHFNLETLRTDSLYQNCEYCIRQLNLEEIADAYLFGFLDFVFDFEQGNQANKNLFLEEWNAKKESAGIASNSANAIQLMTIHKAKGLEFPIVIFPYADVDLYFEMEAKSWFPLNEEDFGFEETLINFNKDVEHFGEKGAEIYQKRRNTLELDNFNLLYVTLTRAVDQLFVFSEKPKPRKDETPTNFNQLFVTYLEHLGVWNEDQIIYEFGTKKNKIQKEIVEAKIQKEACLISTLPETHQINIVTKEASLWESDAEIAINIGSLLHDTMELIKYDHDVSFAIETIKRKESLSTSELNMLEKNVLAIINHPELHHFYKTSDQIENERDIFSNGEIVRPDRLNIHSNNEVTIIDYKTGTVNSKNDRQINRYATSLNEMGYRVSEKIIIYISNQQILINKV
jgi:ATP-dependent exoDNAse (exonuclease V) beta subunit